MLSLLEPSFISESHLITGNHRNEGEMIAENVGVVKKVLLSTDHRYVLLWNDYILEVFQKKPKRLLPIASFNFSSLASDKSVHISFVCEVKELAKEYVHENNNVLFAVALNRKVGGSILCLIDVCLNRVVKCFETPFRITTILSFILCEADARRSLHLADELEAMKGVICVGTEGGLVTFIDLCLDRYEEVDFLIPNKMKFIVKGTNTTKNFDVFDSRSVANVNDQHVCLPLNSESRCKGKFVYRSHDGFALAKFQTHNVFVSALEYILQTNTLCVGFNFGGFQIWNMHSLILECSCSLDNDLLPVLKFAFQEPENDPKNYCYLWVVRGVESSVDLDIRNEVTEPSAAFLYALIFSKKEWTPGLGYVYTNFEMCAIRFEYHMTVNSEYQGCHPTQRSFFIGCDTLLQGPQHLKQFEEENLLTDSSLCAFSWEVWNEQTSQALVFFSIFDLNQWYQCQMPSFISLSQSQCVYCPFFGLYSLSDVCNVVSPDVILNIKLKGDSITSFRPRNNFSDISYYPVSLSFDVVIVTENRVLEANYLGLQRRCLSQIMDKGANVLVDPSDAIKNCVEVGLLSSESSPADVVSQRETLLTLALQNSHLPFITEVIQQWTSDDLSYIGCNCKFILDWIWKHVSVIKSSLDKLTEPLFSYGYILSEVDLDTLHCHEIDLKALTVLLKNLQVLGTPTTEQGLTEINTRIEVTELITTYLRILLWLYGCGLLPERLESEQVIENEFVYPKVAFGNVYDSRRSELNSINPSQINKTELLMIDGVIGQLPAISSLWKQAQGTGLYPPPTIHSLIGIYLLESLPIDLKHFVMLYFLFDVTTFSSVRQNEMTEKLKLFPAAFHLKPGIMKLVQGMWALDHKFFDFALVTLCDPVVKNTLSDNKDDIASFYNELQQRIVTSFLYQQQYQHAMHFMTTCNLLVINTPLKEKIRISILLSNHKILDAFRFQRCCRNENNTEDILLHFFLACEEMNLMHTLFKLPLDTVEEDALIYYLMNISRNRNYAKHLLVLYFLFNNKVVDARNFLEICEKDENNSSDEKFINRNRMLSLIINSYLSSLPSTLSQLEVEINEIERLKAEKRKTTLIVDGKPKVVKPGNISKHAMAHSDVVLNIIEQMEMMCEKKSDEEPSCMTPFRKRIVDSGLLLTQNSPFIRAPVVIESEPVVFKDASYVSVSDVDLPDYRSFFGTPAKISSVPRVDTRQTESTLFSLLHTPPVKRVNATESFSTQASESFFTPSSILKVSSLMQSSSHSCVQKLKSANISKENTSKTKLRFSIPSSKLPSDDNCEKTVMESSSFLREAAPEKMDDTENFVFSPPVFVGGNKDFQNEPMTPTNLPTFVYSPPLTRSRSKQKKISIETAKPL